MHVSAALPYAGGLPPSTFKRSVILIQAMKNAASRQCQVRDVMLMAQSNLSQIKLGTVV